jgi:hypothetical protein
MMTSNDHELTGTAGKGTRMNNDNEMQAGSALDERLDREPK